MVTEDSFQLGLDADPTNSCLRLVFADWLEEMGDWRAEGYRWLGSHGKYPYDWAHSTVVTGFVTFDWYMQDGGAAWDVPYHCRLPGDFREPLKTSLDWPDYETRQLAEEALCRAIKSLGPKRVSRLILQPNIPHLVNVPTKLLKPD